MKRLVTFVVFLATILVFSGYSFAQRGGVPKYPPGVDNQKIQQYCKEIQPLWQKDWQLRGEIISMYAQPNPDWNAIKQKEQERASLRVDMKKKAHEIGLPYGFSGKRGLNIRRLCG